MSDAQQLKHEAESNRAAQPDHHVGEFDSQPFKADIAKGAALIQALKARFACKRYDPAAHISDSDFNTILDAARLSPSSFGFEPWKLLVIENDGLLAQILGCSWGAKRNADRTVVILAKRGVNAQSAWVHHIAHDVQGLSKDDEKARLEAFEGFQRDDLEVLDSDRTLFDWAGKQTYIALSNMLTAAALLGVDATPVEGYNARKLNALLEDRGLMDPKEWGVSVLAQFGVHDPSHHAVRKTRRPFEEVVEYVK